jgi:hypothetical protein
MCAQRSKNIGCARVDCQLFPVVLTTEVELLALPAHRECGAEFRRLEAGDASTGTDRPRSALRSRLGAIADKTAGAGVTRAKAPLGDRAGRRRPCGGCCRRPLPAAERWSAGWCRSRFARTIYGWSEGATTKKCTVVDSKPTTTTTAIVDNGIYKTEAETGMKTTKVCTEQ